MFLIILSHSPAARTRAIDEEDLKDDSHVRSQGNGNGDVAIHFI